MEVCVLACACGLVCVLYLNICIWRF